MRWTGEFRTQGYHKLTENRGVWTLRHRHRSRTEPAGWYLYGPDGVDVVAEWMGDKIAKAQAAATRFVTTYRPEDLVAAAKSAERDGTWERLLADDAA